MATKNLARTVLEGGRLRYNQLERNYSHRQERAYLRQYFAECMGDAEAFDARCVRRRPVVHKGFTDKLNPMRRWLRSQVGRPWNKIRRDVFAKFDTRTLAGYHIVFDHLLGEVLLYGHCEASYWHHRFFVDRQGILQNRTRKGGKRIRRCEPLHTVRTWLAGRRIQRRGTKVYWFEPVNEEAKFYRQGQLAGSADQHRFGQLCDEHRCAVAPGAGALEFRSWCAPEP